MNSQRHRQEQLATDLRATLPVATLPRATLPVATLPRATVSVIVMAALVLLSGCSKPTTPSSPLRLGELLPPSQESLVPLATGLTLQGAAEIIEVDIEAPRATRLEISALGNATRLEVNWQLAGEDGFYPKRVRGLALQPGTEEQHYTLELQGHRAWGGRVTALQLRAYGGALDIVEITAGVPSSPYRNVEIDRRLIPSLTGQERLEIDLPPGLPQYVHFETMLGLLPAARGEGVTVRLAAWVEQGGRLTEWFDTKLTSADGLASWHRLQYTVETVDGGTLVITSDVQQDGQPRSPSTLVLGQPQLLFAQREDHAGGSVEANEVEEVETAKPAQNLLVVAVDTLRADMLGSYGNDENLTPNLDRLASRGFRLADLSAPAPWTLPSFATLMTGLQPQHHDAGSRLIVDGTFHSDQISRLDENHTTLAEILSEAGFRTAGFYTNTFLSPSFGLHQGFDEYQGFEPLTRAATVVDQALEWLAPTRDERFFLFVHFFDPHSPYRPPTDICRRVAERLAPQAEELPCLAERSVKEAQIALHERDWARALYRAEVAYADAQIGRLLKALDERPDGDQTMILLISDHGEELWEREEQRAATGYHPLAGHGHTQFQELLHVPAILDIPGAGSGEVQQATETADLFPTLLALLGLEAPSNHGRDLRPQIAGERVTAPLRLGDFQLYGPPRWSARRGPWKLIVKAGEPEIIELYNLDEDPSEGHNLADDQPALVDELRQRAEAEFLTRASQRPGRQQDGSGQAAQLGEEELERLRTLGYIQ